MIPTLLLAGMILGLIVHRRLLVLAVGVGLISVMWAVGVAVADQGTTGIVATAIGGSALALVNLVIGASVGLGIRALVRSGQRASRNAGQSAP